MRQEAEPTATRSGQPSAQQPVACRQPGRLEPPTVDDGVGVEVLGICGRLVYGNADGLRLRQAHPAWRGQSGKQRAVCGWSAARAARQLTLWGTMQVGPPMAACPAGRACRFKRSLPGLTLSAAHCAIASQAAPSCCKSPCKKQSFVDGLRARWEQRWAHRPTMDGGVAGPPGGLSWANRALARHACAGAHRPPLTVCSLGT